MLTMLVVNIYEFSSSVGSANLSFLTSVTARWLHQLACLTLAIRGHRVSFEYITDRLTFCPYHFTKEKLLFFRRYGDVVFASFEPQLRRFRLQGHLHRIEQKHSQQMAPFKQDADDGQGGESIGRVIVATGPS